MIKEITINNRAYNIRKFLLCLQKYMRITGEKVLKDSKDSSYNLYGCGVIGNCMMCPLKEYCDIDNPQNDDLEKLLNHPEIIRILLYLGYLEQ